MRWPFLKVKYQTFTRLYWYRGCDGTTMPLWVIWKVLELSMQILLLGQLAKSTPNRGEIYNSSADLNPNTISSIQYSSNASKLQAHVEPIKPKTNPKRNIVCEFVPYKPPYWMYICICEIHFQKSGIGHKNKVFAKLHQRRNKKDRLMKVKNNSLRSLPCDVNRYALFSVYTVYMYDIYTMHTNKYRIQFQRSCFKPLPTPKSCRVLAGQRYMIVFLYCAIVICSTSL
jgi:hypothetical protein